MKKTYISPASGVIAINMEMVIAASGIKMDSEHTVDGNDVLSNKRGPWDSAAWCDGEE